MNTQACLIISGFLLSCLLASCSSQAPDLSGRWIITDMANYASLRNHTPWMDFNKGTVQGHSGCNAFFGTYQVKHNHIEFDSLATTQKYCYGPEVKQESALLQLLNAGMDIRQDNNKLIFSIDDIDALVLSPEDFPAQDAEPDIGIPELQETPQAKD